MDHDFRIGDARVTRLDDFHHDRFEPRDLYPGLKDELQEHAGALSPEAFNPETGQLSLNVNAWLVQLPGRIVLIDPGVGNGKNYPGTMFDHLSSTFLEKMAAAGVRPDQVDLVLMSHLHIDHVGWNTRLEGGRWVPTFPNARHVLSSVEQRYNAALEGVEPAPDLPPARLGAPVVNPLLGAYRQSVAPILEAGLADPIEYVDGIELAKGLSLISTPGHSIDHASFRLQSGGEEAIFIVDVMHNPLQAYAPGLRSMFCEFPEPAMKSRMRILEMAADSGATCFSSHFAGSSAGKVERRGDGFSWRFV